MEAGPVVVALKDQCRRVHPRPDDEVERLEPPSKRCSPSSSALARGGTLEFGPRALTSGKPTSSPPNSTTRNRLLEFLKAGNDKCSKKKCSKTLSPGVWVLSPKAKQLGQQQQQQQRQQQHRAQDSAKQYDGMQSPLICMKGLRQRIVMPAYLPHGHQEQLRHEVTLCGSATSLSMEHSAIDAENLAAARAAAARVMAIKAAAAGPILPGPFASVQSSPAQQLPHLQPMNQPLDNTRQEPPQHTLARHRSLPSGLEPPGPGTITRGQPSSNTLRQFTITRRPSTPSGVETGARLPVAPSSREPHFVLPTHQAYPPSPEPHPGMVSRRRSSSSQEPQYLFTRHSSSSSGQEGPLGIPTGAGSHRTSSCSPEPLFTLSNRPSFTSGYTVLEGSDFNGRCMSSSGLEPQYMLAHCPSPSSGVGLQLANLQVSASPSVDYMIAQHLLQVAYPQAQVQQFSLFDQVGRLGQLGQFVLVGVHPTL